VTHPPSAAPNRDPDSPSRTAAARPGGPIVTAPIQRWPAAALSKDAAQPLSGSICATIWPTRSLTSDERWYDEIYLWTEGFQASTTQRARMQLMALETACHMLEREHADHVGVTLSFGTVERFLDDITRVFQDHALVGQRLVVMLRGSIERLRSRYSVRAFIEHLRAQQVPVGYRVSAPHITMDLLALEFLQPSFAKVLAPNSPRLEAWQDFVVEARVAGLPAGRIIVAGLENERQVAFARQMQIGFGQGSAVRPAYAPPSEVGTRTFGPGSTEGASRPR